MTVDGAPSGDGTADARLGHVATPHLPPAPDDTPVPPRWTADDRRFMEVALQEADRAGRRGEVPVGAALVQGGRLLSARGNEREARRDPTAHAELLVLRDAAALLAGWRVLDATLYVTLEPCPMCAGALVVARVARLVYGCPDPKGGGAGGVIDVTGSTGFNHRVDVTGGLLADEAAGLLRSFFAERRG